MKRAGSDYWPLYHDDFWTSPAVLAMSDQGKLLFLFLLGVQWKHGSIPNDPRPVIFGVSNGTRRCIEEVLKQFPSEVEGGVRRNPRLAQEQARLEEKRRLDRARAKNARDARVTSRLQGEERRGEETTPHPPPLQGGPVKPRPPAKTRKIDPATYPLPPALDRPDVREALVAYCTTRKGGVWSEALAVQRVKQLASWGPTRAVAALRHSLGYQGLFEPNAQPARSQGQQAGRATPTAEETSKYLEELRAAPIPQDRPKLTEMLRRHIAPASLTSVTPSVTSNRTTQEVDDGNG